MSIYGMCYFLLLIRIIWYRWSQWKREVRAGVGRSNAVAAAILFILALIVARRRKKEGYSQGPALRVVLIVAVAVAAILFILTQDMTGTIVLADGYTLWHGVITAVSAVIAIISVNSYAEAQGQED